MPPHWLRKLQARTHLRWKRLFGKCKNHVVADAVAACTEQRWSVSQYVAAVRVRRARYLIDNHPELSLGEICLACGFQSQGTFTRAYRTFYGITPSEYRKFASSEP